MAIEIQDSDHQAKPPRCSPAILDYASHAASDGSQEEVCAAARRQAHAWLFAILLAYCVASAASACGSPDAARVLVLTGPSVGCVAVVLLQLVARPFKWLAVFGFIVGMFAAALFTLAVIVSGLRD